MPRISREELREFADAKLEIAGLRRSLEQVLRGEDGFIEIYRIVPTPYGERLDALRLAISYIGTQTDAIATPQAAIDVAKIFVPYLTDREDLPEDAQGSAEDPHE